MRFSLDVHPLVLYFLFVQVFMLPGMYVLALLKQKNKRDAPAPTFRQICRSAIFGISTILVLALITIFEVGIPLFPVWRPRPAEILIGVGLLFGWFVLRALLLPWLRKSAPKNNFLRLPTTLRQLALWSIVSVFAGVGEEIIYRGVLFDSLAWVLHQDIAAAIICSLIFGFLHVGQGWRSGLFIFILALSFQWFVGFAGSLYMAMIVHTAFDIAVGLQHYLAVRQQSSYGPTQQAEVRENS